MRIIKHRVPVEIIPCRRTSEHVIMNAIADAETASRYIRIVEDAEADRLGLRIATARKFVATRIGVSPGTLENLRKLRSKVIPHWIMERIRSEFVAVLRDEVHRLEHEISIARQAGRSHSDHDLAAAQTQLVAAKELLGMKARRATWPTENGRGD
ncbi:MAG: hypothetical protein GC182_09075 [Rhodopseudomonas sp.]|nr:hypothetical protein [Rhodopseudomonas sp.]